MVIILNGMHSKGKFFKSESDRNLWIRLNAQRIEFDQKRRNHRIEFGDVNSPDSCMWISNNQLDYDENNRTEPRFSLEQLASLSMEELVRLDERRYEEMTLDAQHNGKTRSI